MGDRLSVLGEQVQPKWLQAASSPGPRQLVEAAAAAAVAAAAAAAAAAHWKRRLTRVVQRALFQPHARLNGSQLCDHGGGSHCALELIKAVGCSRESNVQLSMGATAALGKHGRNSASTAEWAQPRSAIRSVNPAHLTTHMHHLTQTVLSLAHPQHKVSGVGWN